MCLKNFNWMNYCIINNSVNLYCIENCFIVYICKYKCKVCLNVSNGI